MLTEYFAGIWGINRKSKMRPSTISRSVDEEICRLQRFRFTISENEEVGRAVKESKIVINASIAASISQKGIRQPQSMLPVTKNSSFPNTLYTIVLN
jgi:hypothetical protein